MVRRTIVTSQPEIACDVCARRLLRGEHSEVFLAGGRRHNVCELCAPRATHEGWLREVEHDPLDRAPLRPRRGRSLLGRLRKAPRPGGEEPVRAPRGDPYDFLGDTAPDDRADRPPGGPERSTNGGAVSAPRAAADPVAAAISGALQPAIDIFNAGEYPRRLAGVARSLGVPEVSIHRAGPNAEQVAIVVAWELCWYRYAVDLRAGGDARALAQGTTLEELAPEERSANGSIDDRGALSLAGAGGA